MPPAEQLTLPLAAPPVTAETPPVPARMVNEFVCRPRPAYLMRTQAEWADTGDLAGAGDGDGIVTPVDYKRGQRRHVAPARPPAVEPDVLPLDEPPGAPDLKPRRRMRDELKAIRQRAGTSTTLVHVTRGREEAMAVADTIVAMNEGRVRDRGDPESVHPRPRNTFAAAFMGEANLLDGVIAGVTEDAIVVTTVFGSHGIPHAPAVSAGAGRTRAVSPCFRPEHVQVRPEAGNRIEPGEMEVQDVSLPGTHRRGHLTSDKPPDGTSAAARPPRTERVKPGDRLALGAAPEHAILPTRETE